MPDPAPHTYNVSEIFGPTVQGEGLHSGAPCVFLRLAKCNLWPSPDKKSVTCDFCDTPQLHNGSLSSIDAIMSQVMRMRRSKAYGLVITGGEPLLQLDDVLLDHLATNFAWVDVETNGTIRPKFSMMGRPNVFISCSPKIDKVVVYPAWFKVIIPQKRDLLKYCEVAFPKVPIYLQPCEPAEGLQSLAYEHAVEECLRLAYEHGYRLSLQLHKYLGVK